MGTVHWPPSHNLVDFLDKFNKIIAIISKDNKDCYVMGDFNLDLLHYNHHEPTQEFIDCLFSHMLFPLITKPTRLTAHTTTLIDNIFTNCFAHNILNGIVVNSISDHLPIFGFFGNKSLPQMKHDKKLVREFNETNTAKFKTLSKIDWSGVLADHDPNSSYNAFFSEFSKASETFFPLKPLKGSNARTSWITQGLLRSGRKKNRLYRKFIRNQSPDLEICLKLTETNSII